MIHLLPTGGDEDGFEGWKQSWQKSGHLEPKPVPPFSSLRNNAFVGIGVVSVVMSTTTMHLEQPLVKPENRLKMQLFQRPCTCAQYTIQQSVGELALTQGQLLQARQTHQCFMKPLLKLE